MNKSHYVGIDLGGTSIKMGIVDCDGKLVSSYEKPTPKNSYKEVIQTFYEMFLHLLKEKSFSDKQIIGVGLGVPALMDVEKGFVYEVVNLGWKNVALKEEMEAIFHLPCFIDNDANTAALGEMWQGAGRGAKNLLCVTVGTGVGGGVIIEGDIYHGASGLAGEIGHVPVNVKDGRKCNCGKIGCLESEASATAILYYGTKAIEEGRFVTKMNKTSVKEIIEAAKEGQQVCQEIIERVGFFLGLALAGAAQLLNPEKIVIGGGVSQAGDVFLDPIRQSFKSYALQKITDTTRIVPAELGNQAGTIGAAWLVHKFSKNLKGGEQ